MRKFILSILMSIPLVCFAGISNLPNSRLTPGKANPKLTKEVICAPTFRTSPYRHVTLSQKKRIMKAYGLAWNDRSKVEIDHLISLELGGSNDDSNLWPEYYEPRPGAHEKDTVENYLHKQVCNGNESLDLAQHEISTDWTKVYLKIKK